MTDSEDDKIDPKVLVLLSQRIESAEKSLASAKRILVDVLGGKSMGVSTVVEDDIAERVTDLNMSGGGRIVEGIFDGQSMIGPDKRQYPVPANYASKSKLVEGDILKLTIADDGSFIYKQIGPVQRKRVQGKLSLADAGKYTVDADGTEYQVLLASVTYFQAKGGDTVVLIVPADGKSRWGAIENVIKKGQVKEKQDRKDGLSEFEALPQDS